MDWYVVRMLAVAHSRDNFRGRVSFRDNGIVVAPAAAAVPHASPVMLRTGRVITVIMQYQYVLLQAVATFAHSSAHDHW
jgi:hypothetical protein